ncbi:XRE family transcriptional regulator [Clostridiaceae bacterium]|nr:XRE family transcriptional regulator [Clostridiaceae bacterium]
MGLFERVHELISAQHLTVKQLERDCGLANATIRRWETQTPNIESVRKVASRLNVSIDYLVNGESLNTTDPISQQLSQTELNLVDMFRMLNKHDQENAFDFITMLYEKTTGVRKSIYTTYDTDRILSPSDTETA